MFGLRVTYLTRRVFASVFDEGDFKQTPEWPPHPGRLYHALVSAWAETGRDELQQRFLEWLERQPPPTLRCGEAKPWEMPATYVPVNDDERLDTRSRKPRTFPSLRLDATNTDVDFVWDSDLPAEFEPRLRHLTSAVTYLGHSSTLVWIRPILVTSQLPDWIPDPNGAERLRVPHEGRLTELQSLYDRWKIRPDIKAFRANRGRVGKYMVRSAPTEKAIPESVFREWIFFGFEEKARFPANATRVLTAALRSAAMAQSASWAITGHERHSTLESPKHAEEPHVAYVALPATGGRHASGLVAGLAAILPPLEDTERAVVVEALRSIKTLDVRGRVCPIRALEGPANLKMLTPWPWERPSKTWATVIPMAFDRFPKDGAGSDARAIVAQACERIGLPKPEAVEVGAYPFVSGALPAFDFKPAKAKGSRPARWHSHVLLQFGEIVKGPIIIGAGRYYGYGLCRSMPEGEGQAE
jgi:CRISPR-associated protein Csb2